MATIQTIYSGSSGNCTVVRDKDTTILIDVGKSCRQTINLLYSVGIYASEISAILVTHEHTDHVSGLYTFLKHYSVPIFGSYGTIKYLSDYNLIPKSSIAIGSEPEEEIILENIIFIGFKTSHDSQDCFGYKFLFENGKSAAIATDLGYVSDNVKRFIRGCYFIGLESNYDVGMLQKGPYPSFLKMRICSPHGHLSNDECAKEAAYFAQNGTSNFMLLHLSEENNSPDIALTTCLGVLKNEGIDGCHVSVAPRHHPSMIMEI